MRRLTCAVALLAALGLTRSAAADTIVVNSTGDGSIGPVICTLRDAIGAANLGEKVGGCEGDDGANTIDMTGISGTIELVGSALPGMRGTLVVIGPGPAALTVMAPPDERVFRVQSGRVEIDGLTIAGGASTGDGGGILVQTGATLVLQSCRIRDNDAVRGGGLALESGAEADVTGCTLDGNDATGDGGAILNESSGLGVQISTLSGNTAGGVGGGIAALESSGASQTQVRNATLSANTGTSGGGISFAGAGSASLSHVLLSSNTGGNCAGTLLSVGGNLSDDDSCSLTGPSDQDDVADAGLDATLEDNGGSTPTHALMAESVAIDGGLAACPGLDGEVILLDQRGFPRPTDGDLNGVVRCDAGAVEKVPEPGALALCGAAVGALASLSRRGAGRAARDRSAT